MKPRGGDSWAGVIDLDAHSCFAYGGVNALSEDLVDAVVLAATDRSAFGDEN